MPEQTSQETHQEKVARLIEKHIRDRNMDPSSITTHYSVTDIGIKLDPDFFEARLNLGHGFFKDEPRHLDHMTRNLFISVFLAHRDRPGCYHQGKKAVLMGATYQQMMEGYEAGHMVGGGPVLMNGMHAVQRMMDEGVEPGSQPGPWTNKWVQIGPEQPVSDGEPPAALETDEGGDRVGRILRLIERYHPGEENEDLRKDLAYGARIDPDYLAGFVKLHWGLFQEKPAFLDPIRQEMAKLLILAFHARSDEVYRHTRKILDLGATVEQVLEVFETGVTAAGSMVLLEGLRALRRIQEEQS